MAENAHALIFSHETLVPIGPTSACGLAAGFFAAALHQVDHVLTARQLRASARDVSISCSTGLKFVHTAYKAIPPRPVQFLCPSESRLRSRRAAWISALLISASTLWLWLESYINHEHIPILIEAKESLRCLGDHHRFDGWKLGRPSRHALRDYQTKALRHRRDREYAMRRRT